jgi:phytanoyl-CoA hydroxylase
MALAAECLGCCNVVVLTDQLFMKPPRFGSAKPFHQDNFYFGLVDSGVIVTCWVALEDADSKNGCMKYIDRSHRGGIVPHVNTDPFSPFNLDASPDAVRERGGGEAMPNERLAEVKKGGVIVHHGASLHGSGPNTSDRWRRGYAIVYAAADAVVFDREDRVLLAAAHYKQSWYNQEARV